MEELLDLKQLANDLINEYQTLYTGEEIELPVEFKNRVTQIDNNSILYQRYSAVVSTKGVQKGVLNIFLPNQWFYIASFFTRYYNELQKYKRISTEIFSAERLKGLKNSSLTATEENALEKRYGVRIKDLIKNFVTDYDWWGGGKTIDRGDFFVSPILCYAKLVNATQSYVADLCAFLAKNEDLVKLLLNSVKQYNNTSSSESQNRIISNLPLQQIFYGAPGTGKSHEIKKRTKGQSVIRTTFHPDSDYSTFVGSYKPTMDEVNIQVVPVVVKSGISLQDSGTYKEKRITYKFVMQAFLKAYLKAWKQYADGSHLRFDDKEDLQSQKKQKNKDITVKIDGINWVSNTSMADAGRQILSKYIELVKSEKSVDEIIEEWNTRIAVGGLFKLTRVESVTSNWEKYMVINDTCYFYAGINGKEWPLFCDRVKELFDSMGYKIEIVKLKSPLQAVSNDDKRTLFDDSPMVLNDDKSKSATRNPVFLIIEEINRGNCAQIFGDLFQLLDRSDDGFSEYPIDADTDLQQEIEKAFKESGEYHLDNDINVEGVVENYTSNYGATLSEDIQHGRILLLPSNLYIWATMNTSDQSLFPIDSAFKRRWDWKYVPIDTNKERWTINADGASYDWSDFLEKINAKIESATSSEDKMLGFYFCKAENNIVSAERFVNKVLFYLWNDVFRDYGFDDAVFNDENNNKIAFRKFYKADGKIDETLVKKFLDKLQVCLASENYDEDDAEKVAGVSEKQLRFWEGFNKVRGSHAEYSTIYTEKKPLAQQWMDLAFGTSAYHPSLSVLFTKSVIRVNIWIPESDRSAEIFDYFKENESAINEIAGVTLDFKKSKKSYSITAEKAININDESTWNEAYDWMMSLAVKMKLIKDKYGK